ncbi:MAG: PKD domain-containing protein, partial [Bacteroidota bacterium]|nr:PKD domain-containing protein [Bacteroidota bacterium]MDX5431601.1 PKD domain-containing protein [Bacteroidota bacterium]MDX5470322.1 PKD domain-containing protein [Bacteroidota bacterium]
TAQSPTVSTYYRRIVSSSPCDSNEQSISNRIFILVTAGIGNNSITGDQVICYGQSPDSLIGSSTNGGTGNFTYQWQSSSDGVNWTNISGAVSQHYLSAALTDTMYFRRNVYSQACDLSSNSIKVAVKPLPEPGFTLANTCFPEAAVFNDTSIINQGNLPSRVFLFGDGDSSNSSNPSHYYAAAGSYTVKLIVRSNFGCVDSLSRNYVVYPKPDAQMFQQNICFPFAMDFRDTSTIGSGNITGWRWRFGDGDSSNSQHPSKAYSADGVYSVDLEVTSDFGCKDTAVQNIRVFSKPTPAFGSTEVCFPNTTNFYDSSSINSGQNQVWQWDFGDGSTANQQNPSHAYSVAGTYTVKLRVISDSNC